MTRQRPSRAAPAHELAFAVVPGGVYDIGLSDAEEQAAVRIANPPPFLRDELRPVVRVQLEPFLITTTPVSLAAIRTLGLEAALSRDQAESKREADPAFLQRDVALDVAKRLRGRLPTEAEWEAACRGGTHSLFVWGDALPVHRELARWIDLDRPTQWRSNAFGLSALFAGEWCVDEWRPNHAPGTKPEPGLHVVKGGASLFWPWQGAGEWIWCMLAQRMPSSGLFDDQRCALRVVRDAPR